MTLEVVVAASGGVCRTSDLKRAGLTSHAIREAVSAGRLVRVRQGVYATDASSPVALAAQHGGTIACASALRAYGVWVLDDTGVLHIGVSESARRHPHHSCACVVHRDSRSSGLGTNPLRNALVQVARCLGDEAFFASLESALHQRLLTRADRAWIRARVALRQVRLVDLARVDAESGLESLLRLRLFRLGIMVRSQVRIRGVGRVDFLIGNLIIEVDGRLNHDGQSMRHKDLQRDAAAVRLGFRVLRFDYAMVVHHWELVQQTIISAL